MEGLQTDEAGTVVIEGLETGYYTASFSSTTIVLLPKDLPIIVKDANTISIVSQVLYSSLGGSITPALSGVAVRANLVGSTYFADIESLEDGTWNFPKLPLGTYTISYGKTGYSFSSSDTNLLVREGLSTTTSATANDTRKSVTYDLDGGSGTVPIDSNLYLQGQTVTISTAAATGFTKSGSSFAGWSDGTNIRAPGATFAMPAGNVTLTAVWNTVYSITYYLGGGTNHANNPSAFTQDSSVSLSPATRNGYTFGGWYADDGFTGSPITVINTAGNKELWAKWTANLISYTFHASGATSGTAPSPEPVPLGTQISIPNSSTLLKTGYSLAGWSLMNSSDHTIYKAGDNYTISTSVVFYAVWLHNDPLGLPVSGVVYTGSIGETCFYRINVADLGTLTVKTTAYTQDPYGVLYGPNYAFITANDDYGNYNFQVQTNVTVAGDYYILARSLGMSAQPGFTLETTFVGN
jgi:uncharacterized repeat protein (TIGR02543 family)